MKTIILALLISISIDAQANRKEALWTDGPSGIPNSVLTHEPQVALRPQPPSSNTAQNGDSSGQSPSNPKVAPRRKKLENQTAKPGNLPSYYTNRDFSRLQNTSAAIIVPSSNLKSELTQLKIGDELRAVIDHSIIAFPDESAPVIARIRGGNLDGAKIIGESKLEPNTKRIFISFQTVVFHSKAYALKATALTDEKQNGFEGEYHSQEGKLFAGDFISSTVAAYFDGLVPRQANVFGGQTQDSSVDSAFKKGASGGAMASADRFKERLKKTPEFAELEGPISIEVLILSKAIEI